MYTIHITVVIRQLVLLLVAGKIYTCRERTVVKQHKLYR